MGVGGYSIQRALATSAAGPRARRANTVATIRQCSSFKESQRLHSTVYSDFEIIIFQIQDQLLLLLEQRYQ